MIQPSFETASRFYGGRARIGIDDKYGYIDSTGKIMVAAVYDAALDFSEVVASVMTCTQQKPCKTFTLTGSSGTITNRTGGQWSFIDPDGDTVIPATFDDAGKFSGGLASVKLGESWGYVDKTGAMVIRPQFDDGLDFSEELAAVKIGEKWGYIDNTGAIAIPLQFDSAHGFSDGLAAVAMGQGMDQKWGYIDTTGAMVIQPQFLLGDSFSQGLVQVQLDDGSGGLTFAYVNDTGEYVWKGSTSTLPPAEATPTPELTLPPIPDDVPENRRGGM